MRIILILLLTLQINSLKADEIFLSGTAAEVTPVSCIADFKFKVCNTIIDLSESYQTLVRKKKAA